MLVFYMSCSVWVDPRPSNSDYAQRVQLPNNEVLGIRVVVILVQVLGKHMIIGYLDP